MPDETDTIPYLSEGVRLPVDACSAFTQPRSVMAGIRRRVVCWGAFTGLANATLLDLDSTDGVGTAPQLLRCWPSPSATTVCSSSRGCGVLQQQPRLAFRFLEPAPPLMPAAHSCALATPITKRVVQAAASSTTRGSRLACVASRPSGRAAHRGPCHACLPAPSHWPGTGRSPRRQRRVRGGWPYLESGECEVERHNHPEQLAEHEGEPKVQHMVERELEVPVRMHVRKAVQDLRPTARQDHQHLAPGEDDRAVKLAHGGDDLEGATVRGVRDVGDVHRQAERPRHEQLHQRYQIHAATTVVTCGRHRRVRELTRSLAQLGSNTATGGGH
eukprot:scaffold2827_cov409-Prasinococcus_capsulatus_cf.AAC.3